MKCFVMYRFFGCWSWCVVVVGELVIGVWIYDCDCFLVGGFLCWDDWVSYVVWVLDVVGIIVDDENGCFDVFDVNVCFSYGFRMSVVIGVVRCLDLVCFVVWVFCEFDFYVEIGNEVEWFVVLWEIVVFFDVCIGFLFFLDDVIWYVGNYGVEVVD